MTWSVDEGVTVSISLSVGYEESISLSADVAGRSGHLTVGAVAEIDLRPVHLETLRDQLPGVLTAVGVLDAADDRAADAATRADELERDLRYLARVADSAGEPERAAELGAAAGTLKASVDNLDGTLKALEWAVKAADDASEVAKGLLNDDLANKLLAARLAKAQPAGEQPAPGQPADVP